VDIQALSAISEIQAGWRQCKSCLKMAVAVDDPLYDPLYQEGK
jgi:hypothetical protein